MFDIFGWVTDFIASSLRLIINFVTSPLLNILKSQIPNFSSFFSSANNFIQNYLFAGFQFAKMSIINTLSIDHNVWNLLVVSMGIILSFYVVILAIKLIYNLWSIIHGSQKAN